MKIICILILIIAANAYSQIKYISNSNEFNLVNNKDKLLLINNIKSKDTTVVIIDAYDETENKTIKMIQRDTTIIFEIIEKRITESEPSELMYIAKSNNVEYFFSFSRRLGFLQLYVFYSISKLEIIYAIQYFNISNIKIESVDDDYYKY